MRRKKISSGRKTTKSKSLAVLVVENAKTSEVFQESHILVSESASKIGAPSSATSRGGGRLLRGRLPETAATAAHSGIMLPASTCSPRSLARPFSHSW